MDMPKNKLFQDLTGRSFGRLIVVEYVGPKWPEGKSKGHQWRCRCVCGEEKIVFGMCLKNGNTTSCGCYQKYIIRKRLINLTGKVYGKLTVTEVAGHQCKQTTWKCKCECGNESIVAGNNLKSGKIKSCGCQQGGIVHGLWGKPGYKKYLLTDPVKKLRH